MYMCIPPVFSSGMMTERHSASLRGSATWCLRGQTLRRDPAHQVGRSARHPERSWGCATSQASFSSGMSVNRKASALRKRSSSYYIVILYLLCFFRLLSVTQRAKLKSNTNTAAKIICLSTPDLTEVNNKSITCGANTTAQDVTRPLNHYIIPLPSGRSYRTCMYYKNWKWIGNKAPTFLVATWGTAVKKIPWGPKSIFSGRL